MLVIVSISCGFMTTVNSSSGNFGIIAENDKFLATQTYHRRTVKSFNTVFSTAW